MFRRCVCLCFFFVFVFEFKRFHLFFWCICATGSADVGMQSVWRLLIANSRKETLFSKRSAKFGFNCRLKTSSWAWYYSISANKSSNSNHNSISTWAFVHARSICFWFDLISTLWTRETQTIFWRFRNKKNASRNQSAWVPITACSARVHVRTRKIHGIYYEYMFYYLTCCCFNGQLWLGLKSWYNNK